MERFSQQTTSELVGNYARSIFAEEIYNSSPVMETMKCDGCSRSFDLVDLTAVNDGTESPLFLCCLCDAEFHREPECSCRFYGDQADASGCEEHGEYVAVPAVLTEADLIPAEAAAFLAVVERKPVVVERMQMSLFPQEVA